MTSARPRCSEDALAREESLFATASLVSAWLLIEQPGAWGPDALTESSFPIEIAEELNRRATGVRILLIRHRDESEDGPIFFKAHSGSDGTAPFLVSAPLPDPAALLDVDLQGLADGEPGEGTPIDHPLYLVCTHGRHDICCADKGRPLYRDLSAVRPGRTWEVSHLGGDRFAANVLVLPRGDYFGRVEPEDAELLVSAYEAGRLDLAHHRGRSVLPRLAQAAEHFARGVDGLFGFEDLTLIEYRRPSHNRADVTFLGPRGTIRLEVEARQRGEPSYLTCRADETGEIVSYHLVSITRDPLP